MARAAVVKLLYGKAATNAAKVSLLPASAGPLRALDDVSQTSVSSLKLPRLSNGPGTSSGCSFPMWPHGDRSTGMYCGKPRDLTSYCGEHQALCYQTGTGFLLQEARRKAERAQRRKQMVFGSAA